MLKTMPDSLKISLSLTAHEQAEKFSCYQSNSQKAKQVYLNTLAVMAVNNYLNYLGWNTSLATSDSWDPLLQTLMDVADLDLPQYGKLECRYILSDRDWVEIPAEVSGDRLGYIVVQFQESLRSANLLGFVSQVYRNRIELAQLRSLDDLPYHLSKLKRNRATLVPLKKVLLSTPTEVVQPVRLSQWLEEIFEVDWQPLQELPRTYTKIAYRSLKQLQQQKAGVSRFKILQLTSRHSSKGIKAKISLALILNILPEENLERDISVKIYPLNHHTHLPQGLKVLILDEREIPIMQAQAHDLETIEFRFSGEEGEYFKIKASLNNCERVETFII